MLFFANLNYINKIGGFTKLQGILLKSNNLVMITQILSFIDKFDMNLKVSYWESFFQDVLPYLYSKDF